MPNQTDSVALGIDIGGTKIKTVALKLPDNTVTAENRIDSDAKHGPEAVRKAVHKAVSFYKEQGVKFSRIGIGCAGSVNPKSGVVLNSPNFSEWKDIPLRDWIQNDMGVPVNVENDANCAAFTEWKIGNGRGTQNSVLLTFGTGVGGGVVINERLYCGSTGSAAELGHFSIHADGILCTCGNQGCFERYCSASALEKQLPGFTAKEIFAQANKEAFRATLEAFFHDLKIGVTSIANIFDPDVIMLGGGLFKGITPRLGEIETWVREHAFPAVAKHVRIMPAKYGNQSGAIGAALLSIERARQL